MWWVLVTIMGSGILKNRNGVQIEAVPLFTLCEIAFIKENQIVSMAG